MKQAKESLKEDTDTPRKGKNKFEKEENKEWDRYEFGKF